MSPDLSSYEAVKRYLYSLKHHGAKYGIDRMRLLAERLGHPERQFPVIHVAGTNGKGSVSAMLDALYGAQGFKTGLYTSPHLIRQGERIQVQRKILEETRIVELTLELQEHADALARLDPDNHPSFFEFMTAMAFLEFARQGIDLGILETGLGGRLDATNIVEPELAVITSVSLDHIDILGDSLEKIAREKAGIIKPERPVVLGRLPEPAEAVVRRIAGERKAPVYSVRERFGQTIEIYPETNLEGSFQRINAGIACLVAEVLHEQFPVEEAYTRKALLSVSWPGRWQRVAIEDKHLILDSSHNPEGCEALEENLSALIAETGRKPDIAIGTLGEFRARCLVKTVCRYARNLYLLEPAQPRAATHAFMQSCVPPDFPGDVIPSSVEALFPSPGTCRAGAPGETLVLTGSIYLIGEVSDRLTRRVPADEALLQDPIR